MFDKIDFRRMYLDLFDDPQERLEFALALKTAKNVASHYQTFRANDRFSRACSAMFRAAEGESFSYYEARAYGAPSECNGLIRRGTERRSVEALAELGYTVFQFVGELNDRLDPKTIYSSGLDSTLPEDDVYRGYRLWEHEQARIADLPC